MATVAFFFALTGASMAGVKYIAAVKLLPGITLQSVSRRTVRTAKIW